MNRFLIAAAALAAVLAGGPAFAADSARPAKAHSHHRHARHAHAGSFRALDADRNGRIDLAEWKAGLETRAAKLHAFVVAHADGKGLTVRQLNRLELAKIRDARLQAIPAEVRARWAEHGFAHADRNRDGSIDRAELAAFGAHRHGHGHRHHGERHAGQGRHGKAHHGHAAHHRHGPHHRHAC